MTTKLIINDTEITSIHCENCDKYIHNDEGGFPYNWLNFCCSTKIVKERCILETKGNILVKSWKMYNDGWDSDEEEEDKEEEDEEEEDKEEEDDDEKEPYFMIKIYDKDGEIDNYWEDEETGNYWSGEKGEDEARQEFEKVIRFYETLKNDEGEYDRWVIELVKEVEVEKEVPNGNAFYKTEIEEVIDEFVVNGEN